MDRFCSCTRCLYEAVVPGHGSILLEGQRAPVGMRHRDQLNRRVGNHEYRKWYLSLSN